MEPYVLSRRQVCSQLIESALRQCRASSHRCLSVGALSILSSIEQIFNRFPNVAEPSDRNSYLHIMENYMVLLGASLLYNGTEVPAEVEVIRQSVECAADNAVRYCKDMNNRRTHS